MNKKWWKTERGILIAVSVVLMMSCFLLLNAPLAKSVRADEMQPEAGQELVISVVEELPAEDIEDNNVPLAAAPVSAKSNSTKRGIIIGVIVICLIVYFLFMIRHIRRWHTYRRYSRGE